MSTCASTVSKESIKMPYLWEEKSGLNLHYRAIVMYSAMSNIENIIKDLDCDHKYKLLDQLTILKFNIGEPIEGALTCTP
jgi:hypothetical protein